MLALLLLATVAAIDTGWYDGRDDASTKLSNPAGLQPPADRSLYAVPEVGGLPPEAGMPGGDAPPPTDGDRPAPAAQDAQSQPRVYAAVTGESCTHTADHGYFRKGVSKDWKLRDSGGWTGDGCQGKVMTVPMSGDANRDDESNIVVWWFDPSSVAPGNCTISVYVPDTGRAMDVAGKPAHYLVYAGQTTFTGLGEFDIDQTRNRGRWVEAGRYPVAGRGRIHIRMVTRGIDFGRGRDDAHLGASAVRVDCRAD